MNVSCLKGSYPSLKLICRKVVESFSALPIDVRIGFTEHFHGIVKSAASGCSEKDNGLPLEAVFLDERIDDGGSGIPPYRESDIYDIIGIGTLEILNDGLPP